MRTEIYSKRGGEIRCSLCPCLLKEITELSDSKLSYHLNILEKVKLIESFSQKKWRIYVLTELGKSWMKDE
jgi:ArsR family transcriptional regulator